MEENSFNRKLLLKMRQRKNHLLDIMASMEDQASKEYKYRANEVEYIESNIRRLEREIRISEMHINFIPPKSSRKPLSTIEIVSCVLFACLIVYILYVVMSAPKDPYISTTFIR